MLRKTPPPVGKRAVSSEKVDEMINQTNKLVATTPSVGAETQPITLQFTVGVYSVWFYTRFASTDWEKHLFVCGANVTPGLML